MNFTVLTRHLQGSGSRFRAPGFIFLLLFLLFLAACGDVEAPSGLETAALGKALEAENAQVKTAFTKRADAGASAGGYLTQSGVKNSRNPREEATLDFSVPNKGNYTMWARLYGPSDDEDAVYMGFDGELIRKFTRVHGRYNWIKVSTRELKAGSHRVSIGHAEAGARIDMVVVSDEVLSYKMLNSFVNSRTGAPEGGSVPKGNYLDVMDKLGGFGKSTTGGENGKVIEVTNLKDSGSGSLRDAVGKSGRTWVVFRKGLKGTINLKSTLKVGSDTTIDGRGADITLTGETLEIDGYTEKRVGNNVVVMYLKFVNSKVDALRVRDGAKNVWIHHNSFGRAGDGQIDIINGGSNITISWNYFSNHHKTLLIGLGNKKERVTVHHNYFDGNSERMPRSRGEVHFYNNYVRNWRWVAAYADDGGEIYSEANIYQAGSRKRASNYSSSSPGYMKSVGDKLENGAYFKTTGSSKVFKPSSSYAYKVERADSSLKSKISKNAGWKLVSRSQSSPTTN